MATPNRSRARGAGAVTQTIDQIEARAAEIAEAERSALRDLAEWLRAVAVELPAESKLPLRFSESARTLDLWSTGGHATTGYWCAMDAMVRDCAHEQEALGLLGVIRAIERVPPESGGGRAVHAIVDALRERIDALEA